MGHWVDDYVCLNCESNIPIFSGLSTVSGEGLAWLPTRIPSKSLYLGAPRPTKWRAEILLSSPIHPACPDQRAAQPRAVGDSDPVGGLLLSSLPLPTVGCQLPPRLPSFPASGAAPCRDSSLFCRLSAVNSRLLALSAVERSTVLPILPLVISFVFIQIRTAQFANPLF